MQQDTDRLAQDADTLENLAVHSQDCLNMLLHVLADAVPLPDGLLQALSHQGNDFEACLLDVQELLSSKSAQHVHSETDAQQQAGALQVGQQPVMMNWECLTQCLGRCTCSACSAVQSPGQSALCHLRTLPLFTSQCAHKAHQRRHHRHAAFVIILHAENHIAHLLAGRTRQARAARCRAASSTGAPGATVLHV